MIWTAWNNGDHDPKGTGYGFKVARADRDRHFARDWNTVNIGLPSPPGGSLAVAMVNKPSFWDAQCREMICIGLGKWLLARGAAPWPKGKPPKFVAVSVGERVFRLLGHYEPTQGASSRRGPKASPLFPAINLRCPFCGAFLRSHKASRCLDMWVHYAMGGRPIVLATAEDSPVEQSPGNLYYKQPGRGLIPIPEYSSDMRLAWSIIVEKRQDPQSRRDHFFATLSMLLRGMQPRIPDWPALLLHIYPTVLCVAAIAALASEQASPVGASRRGAAL
jgi:hypothetical protein